MKKNGRKKMNKNNLGDIIRPRVIFSRTNFYIIVQAVDDTKNSTILYYSTQNFKKEGEEKKSYKNKSFAEKIGEKFAENLVNKGIKSIVFDRNGNRYHGVVKTFCDTMRKMGVSF